MGLLPKGAAEATDATMVAIAVMVYKSLTMLFGGWIRVSIERVEKEIVVGEEGNNPIRVVL